MIYDRFVSQGDLTDFLAAADVYVTPYLNPEQITSGTLAYAAGSGRAVVSTPYCYAQELLAEGRGILVPWRDPQAIAREIVRLLDDDGARLALRRRAAAHGHDMLWPAVARNYLRTSTVRRSSTPRGCGASSRRKRRGASCRASRASTSSTSG
jgi:glycosyltransferase involved in cell wall biosynthesis